MVDDMFMLLFVGVSGQATFFMVAERLGLYRLPPDKVPFVMWAAAAAALFWMVAGVVTASLEHTEEIRIQAS